MTISKHVIEAGSKAHYDDADYYEHAYRKRKSDVQFYLDFAIKTKGPVLELGVGTGRVFREIARAGKNIVGVDLSESMLEHARKKVREYPKKTSKHVIRLVCGDIRSVRLRKKFPLVISPFNVWMHLYTRRDIEKGFETVKSHLMPKGRFVFDVLFPDTAAFSRNPERTYSLGKAKVPGELTPIHYSERFEYDPVSQVQLVTMVFSHEKDAEPSWITPLTQRQFFPAELEALLHYNGFSIEALYGDFDKRPLGPESESQIVVAKLR